MNKARILKSALCMTSAITVMVAAKTAPAEASHTNTIDNTSAVAMVSSVSEYSNNSLAGISLSLDKYYTIGFDDSLDLLKDGLKTSGLVAVDSKDVASENAEATVEPTATPKPVSKYADTGISIADNYVNIRSKASTDGEIVGKLYTGSSAKIVDKKGEWVKIKSGSVTGYIKSEYLAIGEAAEKVADKYGKKTATVSTTTIRLREKADTESRTLALLAEGESFPVSKTDDKWAKVTVDDVKGYLSLDYVDVEVKFGKAISIEEEKAAEEAAAREAARQQEERNSNRRPSNSGSNRRPSTGSSSGSGSSGSSSKEDDDYSGSTTGAAIVRYAKKFLGNPYVWGGNSLTRGTDCSGFTKLIYARFGYSLPRSSYAQRSAGRRVSLSNLQVGDLVLYNGHVAIYIGGGKIIHASDRNTGIIITGINYGKRPIGARRILK